MIEEKSLGSLTFMTDQINNDLSLRIDWTLNCIFEYLGRLAQQ